MHRVEQISRNSPHFLSCRSVVCAASSGLSKSASEFLDECAIYLFAVGGAVFVAAGADDIAAASADFAAAGAFFSRAFKRNARIHVLMDASCREALKEQPSLFIMQIRCLWREQWPFKVNKRFFRRMRDIFVSNMTPRPPSVCLAAAGANLAAAGALFFQSV